MGSLRKRYPAQQLRTDKQPPSNGHWESEEEEPSPPPSTQAPGRANSHKRRSYPLQHLSTDRLRQASEPTVEEDDEPEPPPREPQPPAPQKHSSTRRRYPAQSMRTDYGPQTNGVASANDHGHTNGAGHEVQESPHAQSSAHAIPSRANSGRRRPYPAQGLPIDKLPRIEPSRDNLTDENSIQHTPSAPRSPVNEPFTKEKRRLYPTQTLPIDRAPQPKPSREVLSAELRAQHIPPAIHATKNAEASKQRCGRTLVVCLDGTGDKFDSDNSNIVHLVSCLKKDDGSQLVYYQAGIGTYNSGQQLSAGFSAALDMAVGSGLGVHICDAYRFLMATYQEGDRICLFGFSRGAYTARCLAGMIHKVGLLPAHNGAQVAFAYEQYKDETKLGWEMSAEFKKTFCNDVRVYFIGVFDSVASVGFIPRKLPLSSNPACQSGYFRHAIALDEHRAKFKPCRYQKSAQKAVEAGEVKVMHNDPETDVLEVWFAGCHADVGGGAVHNNERHMLSRIPLRWMIRQCFECETGVLFNSAALAEKGLDVQTLFPQYTPLTRPSVEPPPSLLHRYESGSLGPLSRRSSAIETRNASLSRNPFADDQTPHRQIPDMIPEQVEDYFDAMAPINDELVKSYWSWIVLELWPVKVRVQDPHTGVWSKRVRANMGRYRGVPDREPLVHWTVRQRMESKGYKMQVRTAREVGWRVVV